MDLARKEQTATAAIKKRSAVFGAVQRSVTDATARTLQERLGNHGTQLFVARSPELQRKKTACPAGFKRYPEATWFHCGEGGARKLACGVCDETGHRDCKCNSVTGTVGSNIIAPMSTGKCGDIFEVALPGGETRHEAIKAEAPGAVELDMHRDFVVNTLGLPEDQGHYDVCLRRTGRNDSRVIRCGPAKCAVPPSSPNVAMSATGQRAAAIAPQV
jgi:hypothetical protein